MFSLTGLGYFGLFLSSFLAATILPFSSEALLSYMIFQNFNFWYCIILASLGNWLGGMSSYFLGYLGKTHLVDKYLKINNNKIEKAKIYIQRFGGLLAFFCWLPAIGDIIAVALGYSRTNLLIVSILMFAGKAIRYLVWAHLTFQFI